MSLQQLEAFLDRAQGDPSLQAPLASAPDAAAVAAIATAAGFAVTAEDLIAAAGEPPEVLEVIELLASPVDQPQAELQAFLQQVEVDPDLQKVLASAPDAESVAAIARIAGFGVNAEDLWEASDESPFVFELVSYTVADGESFDGETQAAASSPGAPAGLESFLRQVEVDPDLQQALATAADAAAVAEIARGAGFDVGEADLWGASDETPEAPQEPQPDPAAASELADPWGAEETPSQQA
jgi:predicted ribosomally synthesized peptide with nif11-like leader